MKLNSEALGTTIKEKTDWKENHSPNDQCLLCESEPATVPIQIQTLQYKNTIQEEWEIYHTLHGYILYTVGGLFAI